MRQEKEKKEAPVEVSREAEHSESTQLPVSCKSKTSFNTNRKVTGNCKNEKKNLLRTPQMKGAYGYITIKYLEAAGDGHYKGISHFITSTWFLNFVALTCWISITEYEQHKHTLAKTTVHSEVPITKNCTEIFFYRTTSKATSLKHQSLFKGWTVMKSKLYTRQQPAGFVRRVCHVLLYLLHRIIYFAAINSIIFTNLPSIWEERLELFDSTKEMRKWHLEYKIQHLLITTITRIIDQPSRVAKGFWIIHEMV